VFIVIFLNGQGASIFAETELDLWGVSLISTREEGIRNSLNPSQSTGYGLLSRGKFRS